MRAILNEKQWRQFLALEAQERGTILEVAEDAGVSKNTVRRGLEEIEGGDRYAPGARQRKEGGGRKKKESQDETFISDLEGLLDPKGDPMSLVKWTTKSMAHLKQALQALGHHVGESTIRRVLQTLGYSLRSNKKSIEGSSHPDRDGQFVHIKEQCQAFEAQGHPIISVDCKKKELLGNFKNNGREWQAAGEATVVNVYDFLWQTGRPSRMGSMIWCIIVALSTSASIMTRLSLPWRASDAGGSSQANSCIEAESTCSSPPMGVAPTEPEAASGRKSSRSWPMKNI